MIWKKNQIEDEIFIAIKNLYKIKNLHNKNYF